MTFSLFTFPTGGTLSVGPVPAGFVAPEGYATRQDFQSQAELEAAIAAYAPPSPPDWEGFREALYSNADFLDFLESSPLAAKLDDLIWRRQFSPLAATIYARLKAQGLISPELEQFIVGAATTANLQAEFAIVAGQAGSTSPA